MINLEVLPDNITYDEETDSFMVAGYTRLLEYFLNVIDIKGAIGKNYWIILGQGWKIMFFYNNTKYNSIICLYGLFD